MLPPAHAAYVVQGCAAATAAALRALLSCVTHVSAQAVRALQRLTSLVQRALQTMLLPPPAVAAAAAVEEDTPELRALRRPLQRTHAFFQLLSLPVRAWCPPPLCTRGHHSERHRRSRRRDATGRRHRSRSATSLAQL